MKTNWLVGSVFLAGTMVLHAQTNDLSAALRQGLFEEEANRNLDAAVSNYQSLAAQFDQDRQVAATAIFRLGECYRKLGQTNDAVVQYERIVREFSDQTALATLSRQNLTGLGVTSPPHFQQRLQAIITKNPQDSATATTDDEEQEIRRIQAMVQNSPDLKNAPSGEGQLTPLCRAAGNGQVRVAAFLLDSGADVDGQTRGQTPLHWAAGNGHKAMVELLLAHGANVNARNRDGNTPLHEAARNGFQAVTETLLANKADVNARDDSQSTPLHEAAANGHPALVSFLISKGADLDAKDKMGLTPVIRAAMNGHADVLTRLLSAGAKPDAEDDRNRTALSYAAENAHADCVKALLAAKADPNAGQIDLPLAKAVWKKHLEIAEMLLHAGADPNRPAKASTYLNQHGDYSDLSFQQSYGPLSPPPPQSFGPYTPLQIAVAHDDTAMVKLLLQFKADPNTKGPWTADAKPLTFDASQNVEMLKAFLSAGADPNGKDAAGQSLIFAAVPYIKPLETLLNAGADPNSVTSDGTSPLMIAAGNNYSSYGGPEGNVAASKLLIAHGANVNVRNKDGNTALYWTVRMDNRELIELLLASKADVNVRNNEGKTPLDNAKGLGSKGSEIADLLRRHGALDDLPQFDRIRVSRPSANFSDTVFQKGTNDWNRFTLLELIAKQYGFITDQLSGSANPPGPGHFQTWVNASLSFPDFKHVVIHRPASDGRKWTSIPVDVSAILESGDCSRDITLQWGDAVEIPETDHPVSDVWQGFTSSAGTNLIHCISRSVKIVVQGTSTEFKPTLEYATQNPSGFAFSRTSSSFMVRAVLDQSKLIRFSSDLSRVKVTRRDPKTGKKIEWVINCAPSPEAIPPGSSFSQRLQAITERSRNDGQSGAGPDLWLRDGDVIEVPEK